MLRRLHPEAGGHRPRGRPVASKARLGETQGSGKSRAGGVYIRMDLEQAVRGRK